MISENPALDANEWAAAEFDRCTPFIQRAINKAHDETDLDAVREEVTTGKAQIWPTPNACLITQMHNLKNGKRVLHLWLAGGNKTELLKLYEHFVEPWGKSQGCTRMTISGRPGWLRAMKAMGVKPLYMVMGKEL